MAENQTITLSFPEPDIALLTIDAPNNNVNLLSRAVMDELEGHLNKIDARGNVAGLIIHSGKPGMFIAGADLKEFIAWIDCTSDEVISVARRGQQLFSRLATSDYLSITAIDGICVGGGAELAIWCDRRIMSRSDKTSYGFPEVKLGLFPGWGGTARTPRIIGLSNAVELITGGESMDADAARMMGLADDVIEAAGEEVAEQLVAAGIRMVRAEQLSGDFRRDRQRWSGPISLSETELGFLGATASAYIQGQTKGHYPAPMAALELMLGATSVDLMTACEMEATGFAELFGSAINRSLLNVFYLRDRNKKDRGIAGQATPGKISSAALIGAGIMGQGIAAANVKRGIPVTLNDTCQDALARGVQGILSEVSYNKKSRQADINRTLEMAPLVNATTADEEIGTADVVIEAILENPAVKQELFARLEPQLRKDAILCSNTSSIPITTLAEGLKHPERFCGLHFFNPVRKMPLVEVIRGAQTSDQTIATAVAYAKTLGKSPIVMNDGPGFLVNRLLLPYMNEAALLLSSGAAIRDIEKAAKAFGMPMGPITLYDVVGIDTCVHAGQVMLDAFPDRMVAAEITSKLFDAGRLGQKNGQGFFDYNRHKKGKGQESTIVAELIEATIAQRQEFTPEQITERMFFPMLIEATRIIEDNLVRDLRDIDLALIFGIGFPPFKGGLLFWADSIGAATLLEKLKPYEALGKRFEPTGVLCELAKDGKKFYDLAENTGSKP
jgi:3-hydroxyacyl-CoA dehydrogenase/enoyl-CoA hydratase/3-hydroxybutyryl-CoA epimerase/3-hydroxyacyl-CoA dehydrogenase/enoyl-CoA hydratase/3-hydroxybutyryl-CoA epimerase/enoyl-CoA isomerase